MKRHKQKTVTEMLINGVATLFIVLLLIIWHLKKQIWIGIILIVAIYLPLYFFMPVAHAPRANAVYYQHPKTEREQIVNFITDTFGKDAPQALAIFKCESGLNPKAFNSNEAWGGVGVDRGIAQINNKYQLVNNKAFLENWKINILMAKQIFDDRGNWSAWTCSRTLNLN